MLLELRIENFALIERLTLEFEDGLIVLTGETGAGKSIIIDALGAALGERVETEEIRSGQEGARVQAVFDASNCSRALAALRGAGIEPEEDGMVILEREIRATGPNRCRINGKAVALSSLRAAGEHLVDIHGQHEHQTLIREENHLDFLDNFGRRAVHELRTEYAGAWQRVQELRQERARLTEDERTRAQRIDFLRYQVQEIDEAGLEPDEEERLGVERVRLANAEKLRAGALAAGAVLGGEEDALSARDALSMARESVAEVVELDASMTEVLEQVDQASYLVEDACRQLIAYAEAAEADPERLEEVEQRLELIARLKRKYGSSVEEVLEARALAAQELERLAGSEERLAELEAELRRAEAEAGVLAGKLSKVRAQTAKKLSAAVEKEIAPLGMPKASFGVRLEREEAAAGLPVGGKRYAAGERGIDRVAFELTANPGEPRKPLAKVASGGELSRLMLAFKSLCSRGAEIPTLIFDEIDAGIGGRTGHAVGAKLLSVARGTQVLCVTHLPQIARLADQHVRIVKETKGRRTTVRAEVLGPDERIADVARLLGGRELDPTAEQHAAEMLASAQREKAQWRGQRAAAGPD